MAITVRGIEALAHGKIRDSAQAGLSIEATSRGKVWRYYRRVVGSDRLVRGTLGLWPTYSVVEARRWAAELNRQVEAGIDPKAACRASEAAAMMMDDAHSLYMEDIAKGMRKPLKPRTLDDKRAIWQRDVAPKLGKNRLTQITSTNLWDLIEAKGAVAPVRANRLAAELKVFFGWCLSRSATRVGVMLSTDPSSDLNGKHFAESKGRTRALSDQELGWFIRAVADESGLPASKSYRRAFLLMLLTGARISEIRDAPTCEYVSGVWTIPAARTKNGCSHSIKLGPWGRSLMAVEGDWLIPHPRGGTIDSEIWYEVRDRLHARMEAIAGQRLPQWTPHDLRRTMRSNTFELGIRYEVAEVMLNHTKQGLERRYDVADLSQQVSAAFAVWEAKLVRIAKNAGIADQRALAIADIPVPNEFNCSYDDKSSDTASHSGFNKAYDRKGVP